MDGRLSMCTVYCVCSIARERKYEGSLPPSNDIGFEAHGDAFLIMKFSFPSSNIYNDSFFVSLLRVSMTIARFWLNRVS